VGLDLLDHLTHNVKRGQMRTWSTFYRDVFGFEEQKYFDIKGQATGLFSQAMIAPDKAIRIPLNESQDDQSQIEEFIRQYNGEGIQHLALTTDDIYDTVERLRARGVRLQDTIETYYELVDKRVPGSRRGPGAPEEEPHPAGRQGRRGGPAAADLHREPVRPDLLRDHPAQGQPGLRQRQFPGPVREHRAGPDPPRGDHGRGLIFNGYHPGQARSAPIRDRRLSAALPAVPDLPPAAGVVRG
jgi:catechol 2,3-dioxygenase-like lactoylglutathione lyase family enzyme